MLIVEWSSVSGAFFSWIWISLRFASSTMGGDRRKSFEPPAPVAIFRERWIMVANWNYYSLICRCCLRTLQGTNCTAWVWREVEEAWREVVIPARVAELPHWRPDRCAWSEWPRRWLTVRRNWDGKCLRSVTKTCGFCPSPKRTLANPSPNTLL